MSSVVETLNELLDEWLEKSRALNYSPISILEKLCDLVEEQTEIFYKIDPDPFDERHPSRIDPDGGLGMVLKAILKHDDFMNTLVDNYMNTRNYSIKDDSHIISTSCRLFLDILPGMETSFVLSEAEGLLSRLYKWAEEAPEPLSSYSVGIIASAMEIPELAGESKENNAHLVPIMIKRLKTLCNEFKSNQNEMQLPPLKCEAMPQRAFSEIFNSTSNLENSPENLETTLQPKKRKNNLGIETQKSLKSKRLKMKRDDTSFIDTNSNSNWAEMQPHIIGSYKMSPLTSQMKQRLILKYLTALGGYQEHVPAIFEFDALNLLFHYIDLATPNTQHPESELIDACLTFKALHYLASLFVHKKFALAFINSGGLQKLLEIRRPSMAATGVSLCLYYLAYYEEAMERICQLPYAVLEKLIEYILWLLVCSHQSGRTHAVLFFSVSFPFKIILDIFDCQDGLRKLYNNLSTLDIFDDDNNAFVSDDDVFVKRQSCRYSIMALKRYLEAQLILITTRGLICNNIKKSQSTDLDSFMVDNDGPKTDKLHLTYNPQVVHKELGESNVITQSLSRPRVHWDTKPLKLTPEVIVSAIKIISETYHNLSEWNCIQELLKLGVIPLLLKLILLVGEWAFHGRSEIVRNALDILKYATLLNPITQSQLCKTQTFPSCNTNISITAHPSDNQDATTGISVLLACAEACFVNDSEVQKSALNVIGNCLDAKIFSNPNTSSTILIDDMGKADKSFVSHKRRSIKSAEDVFNKIWRCIRNNNGLMVLLNLLTIRTPITDADEIRYLACKALCGLLKSDTVLQIMSKLPLFNNGQFQQLMKEPILQDNLSIHLQFCQYAKQLIQTIKGQKSPSIMAHLSLDQMYRANVVAQTKIRFSKKELLHLIYNYLMEQGFKSASSALFQEARDVLFSSKESYNDDIYTYSGNSINSTLTLLNTPIANSFKHDHQSTSIFTIRGLPCKHRAFQNYPALKPSYNASSHSENNGMNTTESPIISSTNSLLLASHYKKSKNDKVFQSNTNFRDKHNNFGEICITPIKGVGSKPNSIQSGGSRKDIKCKSKCKNKKNSSDNNGIDHRFQELKNNYSTPNSGINLMREISQVVDRSFGGTSPTKKLKMIVSKNSLVSNDSSISGGNKPHSTSKFKKGNASNNSNNAIHEPMNPTDSQNLNIHNNPLHHSTSSPPPLELNFSTSLNTINSNLNQSEPKKPNWQRSNSVFYQQSPALRKLHNIQKLSETAVKLENIVTEYLREQHSHCQNPMAICPPFSLLLPHQCPIARNRRCAPFNIARRYSQIPTYPLYGGLDGKLLNKKFVYGRMRGVKVIRDAEDDSLFTCCTFQKNNLNTLFIGTETGDLKCYNLDTGLEECTYSLSTSADNSDSDPDPGDPVLWCKIWPQLFNQNSSSYNAASPANNHGGQVVLTHTYRSWQHTSYLWVLTDPSTTNTNSIAATTHFLKPKHRFQDLEYPVFNNMGSKPYRILGTDSDKALLYDIETGLKLTTFYEASLSNSYTKNRAVFSPNDERILSDGILWDAETGHWIHKFDKLNPNISGLFHPNGYEVVINSEIWDLRTYKLLKTIPSLDQCRLTFNPTNEIIYGMRYLDIMDEDRLNSDQGILSASRYDTSIKILDSNTDNNNQIATVDIRRLMYDMCPESSDRYLAIVEGDSLFRDTNIGNINTGSGLGPGAGNINNNPTNPASNTFHHLNPTSNNVFGALLNDDFEDRRVCRIYEIGRSKDPLLREVEEEETEAEPDIESGMSSEEDEYGDFTMTELSNSDSDSDSTDSSSSSSSHIPTVDSSSARENAVNIEATAHARSPGSSSRRRRTRLRRRERRPRSNMTTTTSASSTLYNMADAVYPEQGNNNNTTNQVGTSIDNPVNTTIITSTSENLTTTINSLNQNDSSTTTSRTPRTRNSTNTSTSTASNRGNRRRRRGDSGTIIIATTADLIPSSANRNTTSSQARRRSNRLLNCNNSRYGRRTPRRNENSSVYFNEYEVVEEGNEDEEDES